MTVEDVIRSLPGVEILEDGTITVDGKKITNHIFNFPNPSAVDSIVNMHGKEIKQETRAIGAVAHSVCKCVHVRPFVLAAAG